ncbi:uncharacterized protein LOC125043947 isoform X1 [Penaeus chinensis]|uniref:uncharacterized protein LOC125043947 isoform X1 n=1 Tax=Penaeus chinensis TaxID=139456 RepID=UPI001FB6A0D7|nr:uncharacterized protein LOC125043947 isoform X1 [Penaeus chinensis]
MAGLGAKDILRNVTALEQLIEEINFQRAKEMRQCLMSKDDTGFVMVQGTTYWTDLFVRHFLFQTDRSTDADDLLFFIRKKQLKGSRYIPKYQTEVEVYRRDSRKLPIGDPDIDWEETVYLNLIIHQFDYTLTLAVCTRTSPKDLQVLRRHSQKVYASPSRRRMDTKGEVEEITYPSVCFHVDNFDEVFADMLVRDGEMVCVELVASDHAGTRQAVIFLGSIRYDALKRVYDARASLSSKVAQRMMMGLFAGNSNQRIEFVRMKGPQGKGHAEMAVTKPKGSGVETPTSEPGVSLTDMWDSDWDDEPEDRFIYRHQRRLSDPSANFNTFINSGWKSRSEGARSRSENEGLDIFADGLYEIESGDVRDAVCSGRCCSVVACNTIREEEELPQEVQCAKCRHFHGDQTVKSGPTVEASEEAAQTSDTPGPKPECDSPTLEPSLGRPPTPPSPHEGSPLLPSCSRSESPNLVHTESSIQAMSPVECTSDPLLNPVADSPDDHSKQTHTEMSSKSTNVPDTNENTALSSSHKDFVMIESVSRTDVNSEESSETSFISKGIQEQISKANQSSSIHSSPQVIPKVSPMHSAKLGGKKPGGAQRILVASADASLETSAGEPDSLGSLCDTEIESDLVVNAKPIPSTSIMTDDPDEIEEEEPLLKKPPPVGKSLSVDSADMISAVPKVEIVDAATESLTALNLSPVKRKKRRVSVPYRITPDGTKVNFLCDVKLDDGAYNPLWTTKGFTQTFHFWKESRRAQSVPLNAYLTYVTLPWFTIITDILDHRTGPILTF